MLKRGRPIRLPVVLCRRVRSNNLRLHAGSSKTALELSAEYTRYGRYQQQERCTEILDLRRNSTCVTIPDVDCVCGKEINEDFNNPNGS